MENIADARIPFFLLFKRLCYVNLPTRISVIAYNLQFLIPRPGIWQVITAPSLLAVKSAIILYSDTRGVSLMKESASGAETQWVNNVIHLFPGATFHVYTTNFIHTALHKPAVDHTGDIVYITIGTELFSKHFFKHN